MNVNNEFRQSFREACGLAGELRLEVVRDQDANGVTTDCPLPFLVVGRSPRADVVLEDAEVSNRHAYLQAIGGRILCVDLESRTGTRWGQTALQSGWLDPGQAVSVGPFQVRCHIPETVACPRPPANPLASQPPGQGLRPAAAVEFMNGNRPAMVWRLDRVLTLIGQDARCKIRMPKSKVSRIHAALLHTPRGLWLVDLLGHRGVRLNGVDVRWAKLNDGDSLEMDGIVLRVCVDGAGVRGSARVRALGSGHPANGAAVARPEHQPLVNAGGPNAGAVDRSAEALVLPVVEQFTQMQQHMFDQFQQATLLMVQTFAKMHQDQMGVIQQELARLQQLTEELNQVHQEMAKHRALADRPAGAAPAPAPGPAVPGQGTAELTAAQTRVDQPPLPADPAGVPPPVSGPTPPAAGTPAAPAGKSEATHDVHAWLHERFEALQRERQTVWQRLFGFLSR